MAQQIDPLYYANLPAESPPPGVIQNLDHPQSRAFEARVAMSVCIGITTVLVVLRMYVKLAITHMLGWEDCETIGLAFSISPADRNRGLPARIRKSMLRPPSSTALKKYLSRL